MTETVTDSNAHLAVLIDADNADPNIIEPLLAEISKFGTASVKRYGYSKLSDLTEAIGLFSVVRTDSGIRVSEAKQPPATARHPAQGHLLVVRL